jgi:hypothetical protein
MFECATRTTLLQSRGMHSGAIKDSSGWTMSRKQWPRRPGSLLNDGDASLIRRCQRRGMLIVVTACALVLCPVSVSAQQQSTAAGLVQADSSNAASHAEITSKGSSSTAISVAPHSVTERRSQSTAGGTQVTLVALLTQDGQRIDQGLVWRVFQATKAASDAKSSLVSVHREASPVLKLPPGNYTVNAAFGRANLTRRISVKPGAPSVEPFILNAGGLRLTALVGNGEPAPANSVTYDVYSDERDQFGNRAKIMGGAKPGLILRLNSGIYHIVSAYGDANAVVAADVTVEAGKLTEATVSHSAAKVTFKLVTHAGGEALADTQWSIVNAHGEIVKESVGALPTHVLAPGDYTATAKSAGRTFRRDFAVQPGDTAQVEVVMQ